MKVVKINSIILRAYFLLNLEFIYFVLEGPAKGEVRGVVGEIDTTTVVVFVPLVPDTGASVGLDPGGVASTSACGTTVVVDGIGRHSDVPHAGLGMGVLSGSHGRHLLD